MLEAQLLLRMGAAPSEDSVTVAELLQVQLDHGNYSPTSYEDIRGIVSRPPERFRSRSVRDVTPFVLDGLYQQLARDGWSAFRIRRVHEIIGSSYRKRAIPFRWAISNPARDGARCWRSNGATSIWTRDESSSVAHSCTHQPVGP